MEIQFSHCAYPVATNYEMFTVLFFLNDYSHIITLKTNDIYVFMKLV